MAITLSKAQRYLERYQSDLDQVEQRLSVAHGLGDTHGAQGTTATFSDTLKWQKERDRLRGLVDYWQDYVDAIENGTPLPSRSAGITVANISRGY